MQLKAYKFCDPLLQNIIMHSTKQAAQIRAKWFRIKTKEI